jgi:hypothetical protein
MIAAAGTPEFAETPVTARCQKHQGTLQLQEHLQQQGFQTTAVVASKIEDSNSNSDNANNNWDAYKSKNSCQTRDVCTCDWQQQGQVQQPVLRTRTQICWICNEIGLLDEDPDK